VRVAAAAARRILRGQGMPPREIRAILAADDPLFVRRLLELHRERLAEWLEEQQRLVASIEWSLAGEPDMVRSRSQDMTCSVPQGSVVERTETVLSLD
jgi:hypothetical protein